MHLALQTLKGLAVLYTVAVSLCALLFAFSEGRALGDSFWWAFVTATTTGYGDISPVTYIGRGVGLFLMHFGPGFAFPLATAIMASKLIVDRDVFTHEEQEAIQAKLDKILENQKS